MADLVVTAASVLPGSDSVVEDGVSSATLTAGKVVYKSSTTGLWGLADNDSATADVRQALGIALHGASAGQPIRVHKQGDLTFNAVFIAGVAYYLSDTPGGICPVADLLTGDYPCLLGMAKSTTVLAVRIQYPGVAL